MPKINELPEILNLDDDDWILGMDNEGNITGKIKISTLKDYIGVVNTPALPTLAFSSFGDANGMCYWLATRSNNTGWSNPHISDKLTVLSSGVAAGSLSNIVDRQQGSSNYTSNVANSFWGIDFKTHKLIPTDVIIRHDGNTGFYLRSFIVQGSNDGTTWTTLTTQSNNTTINSPFAWVRVPITGVAVGYRYLRVQLTATNTSGTWEFCCSEIEFYGQVEAI
jgi:hypothetical protein